MSSAVRSACTFTVFAVVMADVKRGTAIERITARIITASSVESREKPRWLRLLRHRDVHLLKVDKLINARTALCHRLNETAPHIHHNDTRVRAILQRIFERLRELLLR